jgi:hypothetical protein
VQNYDKYLTSLKYYGNEQKFRDIINELIIPKEILEFDEDNP